MDAGGDNALVVKSPGLGALPYELVELQYAMVHYITEIGNIWKAHEEQTWVNFYTHNRALSYMYHKYKYDATMLRDEFIHYLLPFIHNMDLKTQQLYRLQVFNTHPMYCQVPYGYFLLPQHARKLYKKRPNINPYNAVAPRNVNNPFFPSAQQNNPYDPARLKETRQKIQKVFNMMAKMINHKNCVRKNHNIRWMQQTVRKVIKRKCGPKRWGHRKSGYAYHLKSIINTMHHYAILLFST